MRIVLRPAALAKSRGVALDFARVLSLYRSTPAHIKACASIGCVAVMSLAVALVASGSAESPVQHTMPSDDAIAAFTMPQDEGKTVQMLEEIVADSDMAVSGSVSGEAVAQRLAVLADSSMDLGQPDGFLALPSDSSNPVAGEYLASAMSSIADAGSDAEAFESIPGTTAGPTFGSLAIATPTPVPAPAMFAAPTEPGPSPTPSPEPLPTIEPTPTVIPVETIVPAATPTREPKPEPTSTPVAVIDPTATVINEPTSEPVDESDISDITDDPNYSLESDEDATPEPTVEPTLEPTEEPDDSFDSEDEVTPEPTAEPTEEPTSEGTPESDEDDAKKLMEESLKASYEAGEITKDEYDALRDLLK